MKLTKVQRNILQRMNNGWELGVSSNWNLTSSAWMQQGGLGKGGTADHSIRLNTVHILSKLNLIKVSSDGYPTKHYTLTELGIKEAIQ